MVGPSLPNAAPSTVKFLCSYGGRILPRYPDAKLRYHGGHTRLLSLHRSLPFSELLMKMGELCGSSVSIRCQLPMDDLDTLVSITSDEDFANLVEEYDRVFPSLKIRAFLYPTKAAKKITPPFRRSFDSFVLSPSSSSLDRCTHQIANPVVYQKRSPGKVPHYAYYPHQQRNPSHDYFFHNGDHYQ